MAVCVRFEIYIPLVYTTTEPDPESGKLHLVTHALDDETIEAFIDETRQKYQGVTQINPLGPAFKGWWQSKPGAPISVDYLTSLFGLVRIDRLDDGKKHFNTWKVEFEKSLHQDIVLVVYYPVQILGDFF